MLLTPAIGWMRPASAPGGGHSFTMTAGVFDILIGYADEDVFGLHFGSIDTEPTPGFVVAFILYVQIAPTQFAVFGDAVAQLAGKTVWVDGIEYADGWTSWFFSEATPEVPVTLCLWDIGYGPVLENEGVYLVEVK